MSVVAMPEPAAVAPWQQDHLRPSFLIVGAAAAATTACLAASSLVALVASGSHAALSAAFGGACVLVFFGTGLPVQLMAMGRAMQTGMGLVLVGYASRVALLGMGLVQVTSGRSSFRPDGTVFALALVACTICWIASMVISHSMVRIPVYDRVASKTQNGGK